MQSSPQFPSEVNVVLKYGTSVYDVQDSLQYIQDQFELDGRAPFDTGKVLEIKLGENATDQDIDRLLAHLKNSSLVLNIACVSITTDKVAWTTERQRTIQDHLPRNVATVVTVYDSGKRIQKTVLLCDDDNFPPLTFASLPIDILQDTDAIDLFRHQGLQTLILLPPLDPIAFLQNDLGFQEQLIRSLRMAKQLRKVRVPLDFSIGIKGIIMSLKEIDCFTTLEIEKPSSFDVFNLFATQRIRLDNALLTSLEPFPQLKKLVLDKTILSIPLLDMAKRMFDENIDSDDGKSIVFQAPGQLFHHTPHFLL